MQLICIEYARNVIGYIDANSGEFDKSTKHNIIDYLENQYERELRFQRLLTPYIIWPILFYFIRILLYFKDKTKFYKIKQLLGQLIIGFGIESVFWFQFNLIMAHLIFIIIIFIFKKNYLYYIQLIGILGFLFYPTKFLTEFFKS